VAALRECIEEAGVKGNLGRLLGTFAVSTSLNCIDKTWYMNVISLIIACDRIGYSRSSFSLQIGCFNIPCIMSSPVRLLVGHQYSFLDLVLTGDLN
jgi:uncharacterized membrane protein YjdF